MRTKLYTLVTCLLMAACIASYGQEIIGTYEHDLERTYSYNDLDVFVLPNYKVSAFS